MTQQYEVTWSDGNTYQVDAPEGMSESDVLAQFEIDMGGSTEAQPEPEVGDLGDAFKRSLVSTKGAGQQFVADRLENTAQNAPKSFSDILQSNSNPTTELLGAYASPSALGESAFDYLTSRPAYTKLFGDTSPEERAIEAQIAVGETANELNTIPRVPAMNRIAKAEGAGDTIKALFENGVIDAGEGILALGAESSVPALAGIGTGLLTRNPTAGAAVMGAASGLQENYSQPIEFFSKRGFDLSKREDVERMLASPELMEEAKQKGFTRGMIIGTFAALGGKMAASQLAKAPFKNFTAQMVAQPTVDMSGEALASGITEGKVNWKDVVLEGLGGLATAPVEVIGLNSDIRAAIAAKKNKAADQVTNEDLIDEAAEGNQAAADVLRQMGVTERQLSQMSEGMQESLAASRDEQAVADAQDAADAFAVNNRKIDQGAYVETPEYRTKDIPITGANGKKQTKPRNAETVYDDQNNPIAYRVPIESKARGDVPTGTRITDKLERDTGGTVDRPTKQPGSGQGGALVPTGPDAREQANPMSDEQIAQAQAQNAGGNLQGAAVDEDTDVRRSDDILYTEEGRAPQTRDDKQGQRQAGEAFDQADRQRQRDGEGVADTQTAGRPEGSNQQNIDLHEGFPVRVKERIYDGQTGEVKVEVERYDPRTGKAEPDAKPYIIKESELKQARYADNPRQAQDFETRADVGKVDKGKAKGQRIDEVQDLDRQTFRQTETDPEVPGADGPASNVDDRGPTSRADRPEQPEGPSPWQTRTKTEDEAVAAAKAYAEEQARQEQAKQERAEQARKTGQPEPEPEFEDDGGAFKAKKTSNKPGKVGKDGYYPTHDHEGQRYVTSKEGGAITFPSLKQAALWINNVANNNANEDQFFVATVHPFKQGKANARGMSESLYTVVETKRKVQEEPSAKPDLDAEMKSRADDINKERARPPLNLPSPNAETRPEPEAQPEQQPAPEVTPAPQPAAEQQPAAEPTPQPEAQAETNVDSREQALPKEPKRPSGARRIAINMGGIKFDDVIRHGLRKGRDLGRYIGLLRKEGGSGVSLDRIGERLGEEGYWGFDEDGRSNTWDESDVLDAIENDTLTNEEQAEYEINMAEFKEASRVVSQHDGEFDNWSDDVGIDDYTYDESETVSFKDFERIQNEINEAEARNSGQSTDGQPSDSQTEVASEETGRSGEATGKKDDNSYEQTDQGTQAVIPGTEVTDSDRVSARGRKPMRGGDKPMNEGLYDEDAQNQTDVEDAAPKTKGVNRPSTKFYSFPGALFDKEVYKAIGRDLKSALKSTTFLTQNVGKTVKNILRSALSASDQHMRADFKERGFFTPTAEKIVNMFNAEAGKANEVGETYYSGIERRVGETFNELSNAISKYEDNPEAMARIVGLLRGNPRALRPGTPLHDAAIKVREILDENLRYLREAGVEIGEVKNGYFPREMDTDVVIGKEGAFVLAATQAYKETGMDTASAKASAKALFDELVYGHLAGNRSGGGSSAPFIKGRVFTKAVDNTDHPLNQFLVKDHVGSLTQYLSRSARRAELARRFGDNFKNIEEMEQSLIDEGSGEIIPELRAHIESMTGTANQSGKELKIYQNIRMWSALMYLERATISSLGEIIMPAVRTGNVADLGVAIAETVKGFKKKNKSLAREMAEDLGLITGHIGESLMASRYAGEDMTGQNTSLILDRYFRRTGLEQFTEATRIASMKIGNTFIRRLTKRVGKNGKSAALSSDFLAELGVPKDKAAEFSAWMNKSDGFPSDLDSDMGKIYKTAVWRFVDQTIMRPNKSMKPKWANSNLGQVVYHLQAFTLTFYQNVMKRSGRLAKRAVSEKDLSMQDRAKLLAPAMMLPVLYAFQAAISEIRDELTMEDERRDKETGLSKSIKWMSRSGMFGAADPLVNMAVSNARYNRSAADSMLGPGLGATSKTIDTGLAVLLGNSPNTNTQERKFVRNFYDVLLEPSLNYMISKKLGPAAGPISKLTGAAITQLAGSGKVKEMVLSATAGPYKKPGGSKKGGRPTRESRKSNRPERSSR